MRARRLFHIGLLVLVATEQTVFAQSPQYTQSPSSGVVYYEMPPSWSSPRPTAPVQIAPATSMAPVQTVQTSQTYQAVQWTPVAAANSQPANNPNVVNAAGFAPVAAATPAPSPIAQASYQAVPISPTLVTTNKIAAGGAVANQNPYYTDSPLYSPYAHGFGTPIYSADPRGATVYAPIVNQQVAPVYNTMPAAGVYAGTYSVTTPAPSAPIYRQPPAAAATPMPMPAPPPQQIAVTPNGQIMAPLPQTPPQTQQATPPAPVPPPQNEQPAPNTLAGPTAFASANTAERANPAPFVDHQVFLPGGQIWQEYDISGYTGRFDPSTHPENAIREWILDSTGRDSWAGVDVTSLAVSPTRVRIYNTPQVQQKVADLLGRFLHYSPGRFQTRVSMFNVTDLKWRQEFLSALEPAGELPQGRQAWYIKDRDAARLIEFMGKRNHAKLLANPAFVVANGQEATVEWTGEQKGNFIKNVSLKPETASTNGYEPVRADTEDGVVLKFSPLIEENAATIDMRLHLTVNKLVNKEAVTLHIPGRPRVEVPEVPSAGIDLPDQGLSLPPGRQLLLSVGLVPNMEQRKFWQWPLKKKAELLVLIEIAPEGPNLVAGRVINQQVLKPSFDGEADPKPEPVTKPKSKPRVPFRLTAPVTN